MSRSTRRLCFAAPLILVAACTPKGGGTGGTNPPPPEPERYASWSVTMSGDTCYADDDTPMSCPPDASCNPPPPMTIACPEGMTDEDARIVYQEQAEGPCFLEADDGPQEVDCPSWE